MGEPRDVGVRDAHSTRYQHGVGEPCGVGVRDAPSTRYQRPAERPCLLLCRLARHSDGWPCSSKQSYRSKNKDVSSPCGDSAAQTLECARLRRPSPDHICLLDTNRLLHGTALRLQDASGDDRLQYVPARYIPCYLAHPHDVLVDPRVYPYQILQLSGTPKPAASDPIPARCAARLRSTVRKTHCIEATSHGKNPVD